jgi:hypothetical protein
MEIYEKRGVWYVADPPNDVQKFDSEAAAIAYVACTEPDDMDSILDEDYWDDDEE